jgi:methylenetetrahydrofolate dehydrogenase (NADP+) / methenyltetrahydrofolate cyclohydrolase
MTALLLDGQQLAQTMRAEIASAAAAWSRPHGLRPGLAAVMVGDNTASQIYVRNKRKACEQAGFASWLHQLPSTTTLNELLDLIARLNSDSSVHGILVQLPLPAHLDEAAVVDAVNPLKDVDGFGPVSLGLLSAGRPRFLPCTPNGVLQLLVRNQIPLVGAHAVIIGRSNIVGKPLGLLLLQKGVDASVTVCHSRSRDLPALTRSADIVVVAIGKAEFLTADMIRRGAVVVDVGINRRANGSLCGDVEFAAVRDVASAITPVPGGVGPMTITMLLHNTLLAAQLQTNRKPLASVLEGQGRE